MATSGVRRKRIGARGFVIATGVAVFAMTSACATTRGAGAGAPAGAGPSGATTGLTGMQNVVSDRLVFGQSIPGGGTVSDSAWAAFLRDVISPRFPSGLTVWHADGQWLDSHGATEHESTIIVEVLHVRGDPADSVFAAIAKAYIERFHQDAVLRVTSDAKTQLYESSRSKDRAALARCEKNFARRATAPIPDSAMLGDYDLRMIGEESIMNGKSVIGRLELHRTDSAYAARMKSFRNDRRSDREMIFRSFYEPVIGTVDIDVEHVGASASGNMKSIDPAAPGVFLQQSQPVLVIGAFPLVLDGSSMGLRIIGGNPSGFWGSWSSSLAISNSTTSGRFCAVRRA
jgi:hypothetical protein